MSEVNMVWATPKADQMIGYMARVSNPNASPDDDVSKLIAYLIRHRHWSPFDMANLCLEIVTERDVSRQIIRHSSFKFQEFSQRYAAVDSLPRVKNRAARMQDHKNRQKSIPCRDPDVASWWDREQNRVRAAADAVYAEALEMGIAKEVARSILPEGLTPTKMYVNGTIRSWLHFCDLRRGNGTQKETIEIADKCYAILTDILPDTVAAWKSINGPPVP